MKQTVILLAHGARDARWSLTLGALEAQVQSRLPQALILRAFLEFQPPTLDESLKIALATGRTQITLMPVFWASGGHVANHVTPRLERFRREHPAIELSVMPVVSELPGLLDLIANAVAQRV
ncbi:MAG: CbiX/SirB N-terminal domain-containing protein [Burkholderiaceae bacterium]